MSERKLDDYLGPVEGAWTRELFPIPTPGAVIPLPEGLTLKELDDAWNAAIQAAEEARIKRRTSGTT